MTRHKFATLFDPITFPIIYLPLFYFLYSFVAADTFRDKIWYGCLSLIVICVCYRGVKTQFFERFVIGFEIVLQDETIKFFMSDSTIFSLKFSEIVYKVIYHKSSSSYLICHKQTGFRITSVSPSYLIRYEHKESMNVINFLKENIEYKE